MEACLDKDIVIAVDLDGTLTISDTLYESVLCVLRDNLRNGLALPFLILQGGAAFKAKVADLATLDVTMLPYNAALIDWLKEERAAGRTIVLCTAAEERLAEAVASHLGFFDEVIATKRGIDNEGVTKRATLEEKFGIKGYDYAGNSEVDLEVWAGARQAIVVNANKAVVTQATKGGKVSKFFLVEAVKFSHYYKVFRAHRLLANLLLFLPLFAAHQISSIQSLLTLSFAFLSFSLCASGMYIVNDLLDLESDRRHSRKCTRPFASAAVRIKSGAIAALIFVTAGFLLGLIVGTAFSTWLFAYALLTFAYSFRLKRLVIIDCVTLAALYSFRIIAGAVVVAIPFSFWLLSFFSLIFLSLAFVKRYAELTEQVQVGDNYFYGTGYEVKDRPLLCALGITAGYGAVLMLPLYLHSDITVSLFARPQLVWLSVPLVLFWVSRLWMKVLRGEIIDEPYVFTLKDKVSRVIVLLNVGLFVLVV